MHALPNFAAIDRNGDLYSELDPLQLHTGKTIWIKSVLESALAELQPHPDRVKDKIKDKLVEIFNRHNGVITLCEGTPGLGRYSDFISRGKTAAFVAMLQRIGIGKWIFYPVLYFAAKQEKGSEALFFGSDSENYSIRLGEKYSKTKTPQPMTLMHELTHSFVKAGVDLVDRDYKNSQNFMLTSTIGWSSLSLIETCLYKFTAGTMAINEIQKKYNKENHDEENLAFSVAFYYSLNNRRSSPLINKFIELFVDYDLDLILADNAEGHIDLINALSMENDYTVALHEAVRKIDDVRKANADPLRQSELCLAFAIETEQKIIAGMESTLASLRSPTPHP